MKNRDLQNLTVFYLSLIVADSIDFQKTSNSPKGIAVREAYKE